MEVEEKIFRRTFLGSITSRCYPREQRKSSLVLSMLEDSLSHYSGQPQGPRRSKKARVKIGLNGLHEPFVQGRGWYILVPEG